MAVQAVREGQIIGDERHGVVGYRIQRVQGDRDNGAKHALAETIEAEEEDGQGLAMASTTVCATQPAQRKYCTCKSS